MSSVRKNASSIELPVKQALVLPILLPSTQVPELPTVSAFEAPAGERASCAPLPKMKTRPLPANRTDSKSPAGAVVSHDVDALLESTGRVTVVQVVPSVVRSTLPLV